VISRFERATRPLRHLAALLRRPTTLGARLAAFDEANRVFLVRHTYLSGWYLPGGGVDAGETAAQAARREAQEEGNLVFDGEPELLAVYFNRREWRDHVLLFRARGVRQSTPRRPDREIAESGFFALDALPENVSPATRRRLAEIAGGGPYAPEW